MQPRFNLSGWGGGGVNMTTVVDIDCMLQHTQNPSTKSWSAELLYGFLTEDQNNYTNIC